MTRFRGVVSSSIMTLMIIGMVNGRWLEEVDTFSTMMVSDGVHDHTGNENPPNLLMGVSNYSVSAEKRCESIYGFLPCADTMQEGVFLMLMYTYLMMLGEEWIHKGSQALFELIGNKAIGASIFRVLMALPRIVVVIVSGVLATASDARNQVGFGVNMYAGSTVITLTLIWGIHIILSRDKLRGKSDHDSTNNCLFKLSFLTDTGVNIDEGTGDIAVIMLLSLIPFATVEIVSLIKSTPATILFALLVSAVSLALYFAYQVWNPWIQLRSVAYLKQENLQTWLFFHVQRLAEDELIDEHGNPNIDAFQRIFTKADADKDKYISHEELERLIQNEFNLPEYIISKDYVKAEILTHFGINKSGKIDWPEFQKGCSKWLAKWKNIADNSNSVSQRLWKQVKKVAIKKKRTNLTKIQKIMPRILRQVLEKHKLVNDYGEPDREKIGGLFATYDNDRDDEIGKNELKDFIQTLHFGVALDDNTVLDELMHDFDNDQNNTIHKQEFVDGFIKWINKAIKHDPSIKNPIHAIKNFEEDSWGEFDTMMKSNVPKAHILYVIFGVGIIYLISGAFIQSVVQFSNAASISFLFTSFVKAPVAMNARMVITALLNAGGGQRCASKNASLTFSEIYNGLVMNNLLGLTTLLTTVYIKGLSWSYSAEVLTIMIPCVIVGLFTYKRLTYPLWASISTMLLYPISVYLFYVFDS